MGPNNGFFINMENEMRRFLIIVVLMCLFGPVQYNKGDNEDAIDKEYVVTSLKYYESLIKNYSVSYTQTFRDFNPRYIKWMKEIFDDEISDRDTNYTSTDMIFENGNWRIEGYDVAWDGEKMNIHIETSNSSQRMVYSQNYERGIQAIPGGLIQKPGKIGSNRPRPCDILFTNLKGITFSSIVEDPNTKVYQIKQENRDLIVCEYVDEETNPTLIQKVYLDPNNSFTVVKHEFYRMDTGALWSALENIKYIEAEDGIMFPVYADHILYLADKNGKFPARTLTLEVDEESLKLNQELSQDVFTIEFPKGTLIRDEIIGLDYRVDDNQLLDSLIDDVIQSQKDQEATIREPNIQSSDTEENNQAVLANDKIETNVDVPDTVESTSEDSSKGSLIGFMIIAGTTLLLAIIVSVAYKKRVANRK